MTKFSQKWALATMLESVEEGTEFFYTDFPLHVTLAGVFAINCDGAVLAETLREALAHQVPVEAEADDKDYFGPNKDIVVMKLRKTSQLMGLHKFLHDTLVSAGAVFNEPQYQDEGYIPHSTFQKHAHLNPGDKVLIGSVSIIDLFPNGDGHQRKIFKTIKLPSK